MSCINKYTAYYLKTALFGILSKNDIGENWEHGAGRFCYGEVPGAV